MKYTRMMAMMAAASLAIVPIASASAQADRASAPVENANYLADNDNSRIIVALVAVAAILAAVIITADGEDDDQPVSP